MADDQKGLWLGVYCGLGLDTGAALTVRMTKQFMRGEDRQAYCLERHQWGHLKWLPSRLAHDGVTRKVLNVVNKIIRRCGSTFNAALGNFLCNF